MNEKTDSDLLRAYVEHRSEPTFTELVRRHLNFVFSAAMRMVCDAHLAQDVTQSTFIALGREASKLTYHPVLSGWLHRTAQNIAAQTIRTNVRRSAREQEAALMNELLSAEPDPVWEQVAPHLDAALRELSESDRDALLLRYFERKSAREMAETLQTSEQAAQKRVNRAVERLREFLLKRNVTVGARGLIVMISANAVQAAPAGLLPVISSTAFLAASALPGSAAIAATEIITMTTLQKVSVAALLMVATGISVYEVQRASDLQKRVDTLQTQTSRNVDIGWEREREEMARQLAALRQENERLNQNTAELAKLRGEGARRIQEVSQANDPFVREALLWKAKEAKLRQLFQDHPEKGVPELALLSDEQWLSIARNADMESEKGIRKAQSEARKSAKNNFMHDLRPALDKYVKANDGLLPTDLDQLQPYFKSPVDERMLQQYKLLHFGKYKDVPKGEWVVSDKGVIDEEFDQPWQAGPNGYSLAWTAPAKIEGLIKELGPALERYVSANNGHQPDDPSQLTPYATTPAEQTALKKLLDMGLEVGAKAGKGK